MKRSSKFLILAILLIAVVDSTSLHSQRLSGYDKRKWRKNIMWLEGLGGSGAVGLHYERIFQVGRLFSFRADVGASPFYMSHKYELYTAKSITGIVGGGFYIFPNAFKIGIGCSVLNDFFFDRIPETVTPLDTTHGGTGEMYPGKIYKVRVMPYLVVEGTIKNRIVIRVGYSPIFDPPNDAQKDVYVTQMGTISVGYKFGK